MNAGQTLRWTKIGELSVFEYPQHAGLSTDGRRCFLAEYDDMEYLVWDIEGQKVVWQVNAPTLYDWIEDGHIEIADGPAKGNYRIFGLDHQYPLEVSLAHNITLKLQAELNILNLINSSTGEIEQRLTYNYTTDWAFASFSDDESVIAVLTTHDVTFFGKRLV